MNFENLLKNINENNKLNLNLIKVQFFIKENRINLLLAGDYEYSSIKNILENGLYKQLKDIDIDFKLISLEQYLDYFIKNLVEEVSMLNDYSKDKISITDDCICFCVYSDLVKQKIETTKTFKKFKTIISSYNKSYNFKIEIDDHVLKNIDQIEKAKDAEIMNRIKKQKLLSEKKKEKKKIKEDSDFFSYGFKIKSDVPSTNVENLMVDHNNISVTGIVYELNYVEIKSGAFVKFDLDDGKYAVRCKKYIRSDDLENFKNNFSNGKTIKVIGVYKYDDYDKANIIDVSYLEDAFLETRTDDSVDKRIEFNIHTKYSNLEGLVGVKELVSTLKEWGHKSFGLTDTYNVQAYPEIYGAAKKAGIKLNLGCEFKMLEDKPSILVNPYEIKNLEEKDIVVFDIETTGLSKFNDNITEIGAVKVRNGEVIEVFQKLVNPEMVIPDFIVDLTGITNEMVANEPTIDKIMPEFLDFADNSILAAHNAEFDIGFIQRKSLELGIEFKPIYLDTLWLARALNSDLKNHKLNTLAKHYQVKLLNHHRASDDARATADILIKMLESISSDLKISEINDIETQYEPGRYLSYFNPVFVQNQVGLKNIYINVSESSINYLYKNPGLPWKIFEKYSEGLLIGSGGHKSKLFQLVADGYSDEILLNEAKKFDFITIEPISFYPYLIKRNLIKDKEHLFRIVEKIIDLGNRLNKLVIAIGNVYYLEESDYIYKNILANYPIKRRVDNQGYFFLRTTQEMLAEFEFLGSKSHEIVIDNTHQLNSLIENISPIAKGTFPPVQENAEEILRSSTYEKATSIYGDPLPEHVKKRLDRELNSIISNGYATLYMIAKQLVKKSNDDGYLVGSRGSVGSSFAATMAEITEVNPLEPHYICPSCKHSEFILDQSYGCGVDLPKKSCPKCGHDMNKDGYDIPFEVFLGFEGDKEPDIDLNFAGVYQSSIHKYTETMFGKRKVFRAGTLGTIADKTAYGMARKFKEHYPNDETIKLDPANVDKIKRKLVGVKRTTGQHAGGLIIVPDHKDIEDFTPIQYPADQKDSGVITTHFDYHAIDTNLLKLDLLGHNAPSIIRMLSDDSGLDALNIDLSDEKSMTIFSNTDALNIKHDYTNKDTGSLGIPEFGTGFVRQMLRDTLPTTFEELVRISGLSHGTDVWLNNAQDLINNGITVLKNAICTRDDIMNYLIGQNMNSKLAFDIMEKVRKGKGLSESDEVEMHRLNIPQWYIDSCNKIKYMFPRAHAVAYVMMSYRIAYYKVHYPEYFYSTYFTNKIADFQYSVISKDLNYISMYIKELKQSENFSVDDKFYCLEVAEEMKARDIELLKPSLYVSDPEKFIVVEKGKILPPLMAIDNVSQQIAIRIADARKDGEFLSIEDFTKRSKINKTALASLEAFGMFEGFQRENQLDFFNL